MHGDILVVSSRSEQTGLQRQFMDAMAQLSLDDRLAVPCYAQSFRGSVCCEADYLPLRSFDRKFRLGI